SSSSRTRTRSRATQRRTPSTCASSSSTGWPRTDAVDLHGRWRPRSPVRRVVLLGHGISYSASPAMHAAAFRATGLDWTYELADVAPERLAGAVAALRGAHAAGANVTIPHKIAVMALLDEVEGDAVAVGA